MLGATLQWPVSTLFALSTLALVVGLGSFLREVHMATTRTHLVTRRKKLKKQ